MGCCLSKSESRAGVRSTIELTLPHRESEKAINEYLDTLRKQEVTFPGLVDKITGILTHVQNKVIFTPDKVAIFQRINDGLQLISRRCNLKNQYMINILLNDLIKSLLLIDYAYHSRSPNPEDTIEERERKQSEDDTKQWISSTLVNDIRYKSSDTSRNENLKEVLKVMIKIAEDDLGLSLKGEIQLPKEVAAGHIEKIMNSDENFDVKTNQKK